MGCHARVLLVGFMASGKSTVGRAVAARLAWDFLDFDDAVEEAEGSTISEIFRNRGEEHFRRVEAAVGSRLLARRCVVLASGGGWPARSGRMDSLTGDTLSVWLRVSPEEAVRRAGADGRERPLLEGADPVDRARELLEAREPYYRLADLALDTEGEKPDALVRSVLDRTDPQQC